MNKKIGLVIICLMLSNLIFTETHIPEGEISGDWNQDGSPYILEGLVSVPNDSVLTISPGVEIIFTTNLPFDINGTLVAVGTILDSLYFTNQNATYPKISFNNYNETEQDSSFIKYANFNEVSVYFENSDDIKIKKSIIKNSEGLFLTGSSPILDSLIIRNNYKNSRGGGILCIDGSMPVIKNSLILDNESIFGGGIGLLNNSNATIKNTSILNNTASSGGGLYAHNSSPFIENTIIQYNNASSGGGGLYLTTENFEETPTPVIINSAIDENNAYAGGGILFDNIELVIHSTTINGNTSLSSGGGIKFQENGYLYLERAIIRNNNSGDIGGGIHISSEDEYCSADVVNTLIAGNHANEAGGIYISSSSLCLSNVTVTENSILDDCHVGGLAAELNSDLYLHNSIVFNNSMAELFIYGNNTLEISYSNIGDSIWEGVGIINTDPLFSDENYHLTNDSPCIDSGNPNPLFNDIEDPQNPGFALYPAMCTLRNDMGAYGGNGYFEYYVGTNQNEIPPNLNINLSNYPNPFNPETTISFELPVNINNPMIEIFNIKGQQIRQYPIFNNQSSIIWDGIDHANNPVSSGVYFYRINSDEGVLTSGKMLLLK